MRVNDALIGALLLLFAVALALYAQTFPAIPGQQFGAAVFPTAIAVVVGAFSLILIVQGMRSWQGMVTWSDWAHSHHGPLNLITAFGGVLFYVFVADALGFIPTMAAILIVLFFILQVRWWLALLVTAAVTLGMDVMFVDLLKVPLPWGIVPVFSW